HFLLKHCFSGNYSAPVRDLLQQPASHPPPTSHPNGSSMTLSIPSSQSINTDTTQSSEALGYVKVSPRVLDIACGSGIWILEMASEFPHAQFYGIDLSNMYPSDIKPPNTHFCQGDVLNGLPYPDGHFDYVHMSFVYNCFSYDDRKMVLREIRRVMKPGAYVEFRDAEAMVRNAGPFTAKFVKPFANAMMEHLDVDVTWTTHMCENLQHVAGMADIHHQIVSINFVSSSKLSNTFNATIRSELEGYRWFCQRAYGFSDSDYDLVMDQFIEECKKERSYLNYVMCWGRKPIIQVPSNPSLEHIFGTPPHRSESPPLHPPLLIKAASSPNPHHAVLQRSPKLPSAGSSSLIPSCKNSPGSLKAREDARRNKEKTSDIYQFVHGYIE
ncbi:hypothetical protein BJV82DRAFT_507468, partial [Fennellomyces sp. T-0311]